MKEACKRANILEFIQGLPQGFETIIGENSVRLSGGQRQRLQIARLFLQNLEVIIFDENCRNACRGEKELNSIRQT